MWYLEGKNIMMLREWYSIFWCIIAGFKLYYIFKRFYLFIFGKRERERERKGEKHQCVVASRAPPAGDLTCNPGMCPDWELNCDPLVPRPALNPLSYTSQGRKIYFYSHTPFFPPLPCPHICQLTFFKVSSFESSRLSCISY